MIVIWTNKVRRGIGQAPKHALATRLASGSGQLVIDKDTQVSFQRSVASCNRRNVKASRDHESFFFTKSAYDDTRSRAYIIGPET